MSESISVLHVEDDPDVAEVTADFLEQEENRITVVTETHVSDGLDRLATKEFDCVISEHDMPGMDGLAFLDHVRANYDDLPFILFTGKGSEKVASEALSAGATDYLQKEVGTDQYAILANRVMNSVGIARANRQRQRQLDALETAQDGISILDDDGQFIFVNEAYADLYGYEREDMIGEHWALIYPDDDVDFVREEILPTVTDDGEWQGETTGLRADGSTFVEDHTLTTTDYGELICTVRDITDRKEREQALQQERAFTQSVLDTLSDLFYAVDDSGEFLQWNVRLTEETGYSDEEIAAMQPTDFFAGDDVERIAAAIDRALTEGEATVEADIVTKNGGTIPYELNASRITDEGRTVVGFVGIGRDISERKERERQLQAERDRLAALFESVPEPVARARFDDATPRIQDINTAFETTFGVTADEAVGESLNDLIVPAEPSEEAADIDHRVQSGDPVEREIRRQGVDGLRDFLFRSVPVERSASGAPLEQFGVYIDITEQKDRERELTRYEEMLNQAGDIVYTADADGYLTAVNDAAVSFLGYDRKELLGAHVSIVMDDEDIATGEQRIRELLADPDRTQSTFEMALITAAGERIQCEDHIHLLTSDGKFHGTVGVLRDITERKRLEQQLQTLHEATRDMMTAVTRQEVADITTEAGDDILDVPVNIHLYDEDAEGLAPVAVSPKTLAVLGTPPTIQAGEGIAWRVFESGHPEIYADVRTAPGVLNPETPIRSEYCLPLGDHGVLLAASTTVDAFDETDISLLKILVATVETAFDRACREQKLQKRERELQRQNDRLDEFANMVSHDLRNPLTVAMGRLELARETSDTEHFEAIADAQSRMKRIVEDVLTLAREGDAVGDTEPVELDMIARRAWDNVETGPASFQCDTDREIEVDASRVGQLFENLFRNAVEHGGGEVTVSVGWLEESAGFYIEDTGPGIPREERASVFESGYTTKTKGTGFGLAIVEEIAVAHGWEINVMDGRDGGARFEILVESGTG